MPRMMQTHKRRPHLAWLGLVIFVAPVAAWAQSAAPASTLADKSLTVATAYAPKSLDAAMASDAAAARLLQLTNPALLKYDNAFQPVGLVAKGCEQPAPTQVVCTLPQGRRYHDGTPLTAQTVADWFAYLQTAKGSPLTGALSNIQGVKAPHPQKVEFTLVSPSIAFLNTLTTLPLAVAPVNPSASVALGRAGLGAYRVTEADTLGNTTLTAVDKTIQPQSLRFVHVPDPTVRLLKLKKAEVDVVYDDLPPELFRWAADVQKWPYATQPSTSYSYLAVNFGNPWLANPQVRQAISLALNREEIRKYVLGGLAEPATTLLPASHAAALQKREDPFDPMTAENLLDDADTFPGPEGRFSLTLSTSTDALAQRVAQVLKAQLAEVGITLNVKPTEWGSFYTAIKKGQFDLALLSWSGQQTPEFYYQLFNSASMPPNGFNRGRVNDAEMDRLTQTVRDAKSVAAQTQAALAVQEHAARFRPYIPLYRRHHTLLARTGVTGCYIPPDGSYTGLTACRLPK